MKFHCPKLARHLQEAEASKRSENVTFLGFWINCSNDNREINPKNYKVTELTGLSGTMCLPTGRPMPERRRREEATERETMPFPPMIRDATLLNLPAIFFSSHFLHNLPTVVILLDPCEAMGHEPIIKPQLAVG